MKDPFKQSWVWLGMFAVSWIAFLIVFEILTGFLDQNLAQVFSISFLH